MSYVGNKPAQTTIPVDDTVTTTMLQDDAVTSAKIDDATIVNADVNASAGIVQSKLATLAITDSEVADNALSGNKIDGGTISDFASTGIDDNAASTAVIIDSTGAMTKTLQPAFLAYLAANTHNVTGNNVRYYVICDIETFDQNADYNNTTGTFTAPVTGRYYLHGSITTGEQTPTNTDADMEVVTSNATMSKYYNPANMEGPASSGQCTVEMNGFFDMDASDTFRMNVVFVQGAQDIDVYAANNTFMSAVLIC